MKGIPLLVLTSLVLGCRARPDTEVPATELATWTAVDVEGSLQAMVSDDGSTLYWLDPGTSGTARGDLWMLDLATREQEFIGPELDLPYFTHGPEVGVIWVRPDPEEGIHGAWLYLFDVASRELRHLGDQVVWYQSDAAPVSRVIWMTEQFELGVWTAGDPETTVLATDLLRSTVLPPTGPDAEWVVWADESSGAHVLHARFLDEGVAFEIPLAPDIGPPVHALVSDDRTRIVFSAYQGVFAWDTAAGTLTTLEPEEQQTWMAMRPDGSTVVWTTHTGRTLRATLSDGVVTELASTGEYTSAAASPDLDTVLIEGGADPGIWVWTAGDGLVELGEGHTPCLPKDPSTASVWFVTEDETLMQWSHTAGTVAHGGGFGVFRCGWTDDVGLFSRRVGDVSGLWAVDYLTDVVTELRTPAAFPWAFTSDRGVLFSNSVGDDRYDWYQWAPGEDTELVVEGWYDSPPAYYSEGRRITPNREPLLGLSLWDGPTRTRVEFAENIDTSPPVDPNFAASSNGMTVVYPSLDDRLLEWNATTGETLEVPGGARRLISTYRDRQNDSHGLITPDGICEPGDCAGMLSLRRFGGPEVPIGRAQAAYALGFDVFVMLSQPERDGPSSVKMLLPD